MNWVWPKAPAQDPTNRSAGTSPAWMMRKVSISSPRKNSWRRPMHDSVVSDSSNGRFPKTLPKSLSTPQTATTVAGSTP